MGTKKSPARRRQQKPSARRQTKPRRARKPAAESGSAKQVKLTAEQTLGVQLMLARETIKTKNTFIAQNQLSRSAAAQSDAQRIKDLERENGDLTNQLMGALNRAEAAENNALSQRLGLPAGEISYQMGPDGLYSYEVGGKDEAAPKAPAVMPPLDEDEDEETDAERRARLKQELAELGEDEDPAPEEPPAE